MTTTKNLKNTLIPFGVPILFSVSLMLAALLSLPPFLIGMHERFTFGILGSMTALLIIYIFLKIERKSWSDYFLILESKTLIRFTNGSIIGLLLASVMFGLQAWYSGLQITFTNADLSRFSLMSLSLIPLAFMEELAFRSFTFIKLNKTYGVWVAQIAMAIMFALYHYIGGWSLLASFIGPGIWSFAFGLMALKSKGIALPTGFHFGLNLALAAIGSKYWVPGLLNIDFAGSPTDEMLKLNEYFGVAIQLVVFVILLVLTHRYTKKIHGKKQSN